MREQALHQVRKNEPNPLYWKTIRTTNAPSFSVARSSRSGKVASMLLKSWPAQAKRFLSHCSF